MVWPARNVQIQDPDAGKFQGSTTVEGEVMETLVAHTERDSVVARNFAICDKFKELLSSIEIEFVEKLRRLPPQFLSNGDFHRLNNIARRVS